MKRTQTGRKKEHRSLKEVQEGKKNLRRNWGLQAKKAVAGKKRDKNYRP